LVAKTILGMMPGPERQRIIGIEIEIEVRPSVGAPEARESIPGCAGLQVEAPAQESHRSRLYGGLELHILSDTERGVGASARLSAENLIGICADPCARIIGTPAKIDVRSEVVGVGIFTYRELPRQRGAVGRRATTAEDYAQTAGNSDPHNGDCSRFECAGMFPAQVSAARSASMMH
jgi:hypothetical protein